MQLEHWIFLVVGVPITLVYLFLHFVARLAGKFEDWVYTPVCDAELPRSTLAYFQKVERDLTALSFTRVATCLQRPKPKLTYVRHLIHADGRVLATIDDIRYPLSHAQAYGLVSVLADGLYIESTAMNMPLPKPHLDKLRFVQAVGASAEQLLEVHRDAVREAEEERGCQALEFDPEQFHEVCTYGHRLAAWDMYQKGIKTEPPTLHVPELAAK